MHRYLIDMLVCPVCYEELAWRIDEAAGERIETAEAECVGCEAVYPVREEIGLFLTPDLPRNDLWEEVGSGLVRYLQAHPELERQLVDGPVESLAPADQFLRTLVLEERGDFGEAKIVQESAFKEMYTPAYMDCWQSQVDYVLEAVSRTKGPVVDLASGRGYLVEILVRRLQRFVVATDFSPGVLRRNRQWLMDIGLYEYVSLLAFDARRTPFRDGAVETLTTNLGLPNIEEPGDLLKELRRIVSGTFLAVSHFYPEDDAANGKVIRAARLDLLLYRRSALAQFMEAGWVVAVQNECVGEGRPTPPSAVVEGLRIDGLPVAETMLAWCVLLGRGVILNC